MSFQAVAAAMKRKTGSASAKAVLLAIANYAGDAGESYAGIPRLADDTEQSADTVRRRLGDLEDAGLIARCARYADNGRQLSDWIVLLFCDGAEQFARGHGWRPELRAARRAAAENGETAAPNPDAPTLANCEGIPLQNAGGTLADCEGDPSSCATPRIVKDPIKETLSDAGELEGERELCDEDKALRDFMGEWSKFCDAWRWLENESQIIAQGIYRRLSRADRDLARRYAQKYLADCKARKKPQVFCGNWLSNRGWTEYVIGETAAADRLRLQHEAQRAKYGGVLIRRDSAEAAAWMAYERKLNPKAKIEFTVIGQYAVRPSQWPPSAKARAGPQGDDAA